MSRLKLIFEILDYWHAGSGYGEGANLDAMVVRSSAGLPYLPGRTIKGLLREAVTLAEECKRVPETTAELLFGTASNTVSRYETEPGALTFTNATLGDGMETWANENRGKREHLFTSITSTKIEPNGQANDHSLRSVEYAIPVTLHAYVEYLGENCPEWKNHVKTAAPLVRYIGTNRHRGFGRTRVTVEEVGE